MAAIGLSAFSVFFMGSPSFLEHQRVLERGQGRSNCQGLFGMAAIPSDNYIRLMLDGAAPASFDGLFMRAIEKAGSLTRFQCLGGRVLIALDGSEYFCSRKIQCSQCSTRRRSDGGTEYFHGFLGASVGAPGHQQVLALPPARGGHRLDVPGAAGGVRPAWPAAEPVHRPGQPLLLHPGGWGS